MTRIYCGVIVWASIPDGHGNAKIRPCVVIDFDSDDVLNPQILVVPITKSSDQPCPHYHIQVHYFHDKDPTTGLYYPCWAKCNWPRWINETQVRDRCGDIPDDLFSLIADAFDRINNDEFDDWQ